MPIPPKNKRPDDGGFETLAPSEAPPVQPSRRGALSDPAGGGKPPARRAGISLKARAVAYLSQREYARDELARKLRPYAEDPAEIETVLDALRREAWQSNERFAQSLVHRRAPLRGAARIIQELRQHGVEDAVLAQAGAQLKATEYERAQRVWAKRYGAKPTDRSDYARQARFLAGRGFSPETIRRVLGEAGEDA